MLEANKGRKGREPTEPPEPTREEQLQSLIDEKIMLATALGLMHVAFPEDDSYKHTKEFKRLKEIDRILWNYI